MDGLTGQLLAQGAVDELVLLHPAQAREGRGHDADLQVIATPSQVFHLDGRIR